MKNKELQELDQTFIASTYKRFPVSIESGSGSTCKDFEGNSYIDFAAGIAVNSLGYCDKQWVKAVSNQAGKLAHTSNLYYTEPAAILAEKLCKKTGFKKVFFGNSGAEANEAAIKTARKYSSDHYGENRNRIIALQNSFHGRTITTLSATGQSSFHEHFFPFTEGFDFAKANDFESVVELITDQTCAIMIELIQGEGGIRTLEKDFVQKVQQLCNELDLLLIIDEVQTGIGRTGSFLLAQKYDCQPDIVSLAKGLGGGLPIGATLFGEKVQDTMGFGSHGSTFGGNPVVCAGANVVVDRLDEVFMQNVIQKSNQMRKQLQEIAEVEEVLGVGLMIGVKLKTKIAAQVVQECIEKGLLILTAKDRLRLLPALNISDIEIEKGMNILTNVLNTEA